MQTNFVIAKSQPWVYSYRLLANFANLSLNILIKKILKKRECTERKRKIVARCKLDHEQVLQVVLTFVYHTTFSVYVWLHAQHFAQHCSAFTNGMSLDHLRAKRT